MPSTEEREAEMTMGLATPHICISGYYGFDNAGDEAVLDAMVGSLRRLAPGVAITVLSADPSRTSRQLGVRAVPRMAPWRVLSAIAGSDLVVSGGGSLFQDSTSARTVPYYAAIVHAARLLHKPCMMYAQGVGPLRAGSSRAMVSSLAHRFAAISVRDADSARLLCELGYAGDAVRLTADPAFTLPELLPAEGTALFERLGLGVEPSVESQGDEGRRLRIGVAVRRVELDDPADACAFMVRRLAEERRAEVVLVPFHQPDDLRASDMVAEAAGPSNCVVLRPALTPREILSVLGSCDAVVGMRLHSLILAARMGVPIVGLTYDPKVSSFCERVGAVHLPLHHLAGETLYGAVEGVLADHAGAAARISEQARSLALLAEDTARVALALARGKERES